MSFNLGKKEEKFFVPQCNKCRRVIWPPSEFCDECFGDTSQSEISSKGVIIEISKHNEKFFCVAEIGNSVKLIGEIVNGIPSIGKTVNLVELIAENKKYIFKMNVID